jgi:hypothetical protein
MKQRYTYYPEFDTNDYLLWHVFETATEQVIDSYFFEEDAAKVAWELEKGSGFAGFTPAFMLRKTTFVNINDAFEAEFS